MILRELLLQKDKPKHQFPDEESIDWIVNHRPLNLSKQWKPREDFVYYIDEVHPWSLIQRKWFTNDSIYNGIHGVRHCFRVGIYTVLIGLRYFGLDEKLALEALLYAGLFHDCRRNNDNTDKRHGLRASRWLTKNSKEIPQHLSELRECICFAVRYHNQETSQKDNKESKKNVFLNILKTADALDRYRFPREDWWINSKYLNIQPLSSELAAAFEFTTLSEKLFTQIYDSEKSLLASWEKFKELDC